MSRPLGCLFVLGAAAAGAVAAGERPIELGVYLTAGPAPAACDDASLRPLVDQAPLGERLFGEAEIEAVDWDRQAFVLAESVSRRLWTNLASFQAEQAEEPEGRLFELGGRVFVVTLGDRRVAGGLVAGLETLREPQPCPLLYPTFDYVPGRLVLAFGRPRSREELGEDFFKVLAEEGAANAFRPVLGPEVKSRLIAAGKLSDP